MEHKVPLYAELQGFSGSSIELSLRFNAYLLKITGVHAGAGHLISEENPLYKIEINDVSNARLIIYSSNINFSNGKIATINLESLAGPDSIALLNNPLLKIDGKDVISSFEGGRFSIGIPVFPVKSEFLSLNYPNPFSGSTIFRFGLANKTRIKFYIFNISGSKLEIYPEEEASYFRYRFFDANDALMTGDMTGELPEGFYKLQLEPLSWKISSGLYRITMETSSGSYTINFMYAK